jgi:RNA polymerase sigma-70 factor, ECF subfamily
MSIGSPEPVATAGEVAAAEQDLVRRVQQGDTEAFDQLVRAFMRRARAIAGRMTRTPEDADDLVQDAFLRALERIDSFDMRRPFGPWFFRLLVNVGNDSYRRQAVRATEPERDDIAAADPTPHQDAENAEIRRRFEAALDQLPPRQRLIVSSFEVDGMSTEEIATSLGISQVTVRWHLHQGRRALREALADLHG